MNISIYPMTLQDLIDIKNILTTCFDDFWNYNTLEDELKNNNSKFIVAKNEFNEILGFAGLKIILDEADIMNIVVKKDYRNNGIGSILLKNLIEISKKYNATNINLEVNKNNIIAIHLYEKLGFKTLGIRKKYYNGVDDAIIMKHTV